MICILVYILSIVYPLFCLISLKNMSLFSLRFTYFSLPQRRKFFVKDFFCKCDQIHSFLQIWSPAGLVTCTEEILNKIFFFIFCSVFPQPVGINFFSIRVFFLEHSRFTGQQGREEAIYLTPLYHLHQLRRRLEISWGITVENSPLHKACSRVLAANL